MGACTAANLSMKIQDDHLQFGNMNVPLGTARICRVLSDDTLHIFCSSVKGKSYDAGITLKLQNIEKARECFRLIIEDTKIPLSFPRINKIEPNAGSVTFVFKNEEDSEQFQIFYAPNFFPEQEFECKLDENRCDLISFNRGERSEQVKRINEILARLNDRFEDPEIDNLLFENGTLEFPGKKHEEKSIFDDDFDPSADNSQGFVVTQDTISIVTWGRNGMCNEAPTTIGSLYQWINKRTYDQAYLDKKCWECLRDELIESQNPSYSTYIALIEEIIDELDVTPNFSARNLQSISTLFDDADNDKVLDEILSRCFQ